MLDPIGGHLRLREFFIRYLDTAYRIRHPGLADDRRELLRQQGTLTTNPFLEPVLRYVSCGYRLEDLLTKTDDNPLADFDLPARRLFIDLALSGLFDGADAGAGAPLLRRSKYSPYQHQMQMLGRGV